MTQPLLMTLSELAVRKGVYGGAFIAGAEQNRYQAILQGVDQAVRDYCHWNIGLVNNDVQYYSGNGQQDLVLRTPWVLDYVVPASPTGGAAFTATTITRSSGSWITAGMLEGGTVTITDAEDAANNGTFGPITALSATVITIASAAFTVNADDDSAVFDPDRIKVWLDQGGFYGHGSGAFADATRLTYGNQVVLKLEGTRGKSGILQRIGVNSTAGGNPLLFPTNFIYNRGSISGLAWWRGPFWQPGTGNIKVQCSYGFAQGEVPDDIKLAITQAVTIAANLTQYGYPLNSEGLGDYNYSANIGGSPEFASVRAILRSYRDVAIGGF